jgi:hypothetical protein
MTYPLLLTKEDLQILQMIRPTLPISDNLQDDISESCSFNLILIDFIDRFSLIIGTTVLNYVVRVNVR